MTNRKNPLHIDIGCGKGLFLQRMAELHPDWNFLGLEIRKPVVEQAQRRFEDLGLANLHIMFCNVNISFPALMTSLGNPKPVTAGLYSVSRPVV